MRHEWIYDLWKWSISVCADHYDAVRCRFQPEVSSREREQEPLQRPSVISSQFLQFSRTLYVVHFFIHTYEQGKPRERARALEILKIYSLIAETKRTTQKKENL